MNNALKFYHDYGLKPETVESTDLKDSLSIIGVSQTNNGEQFIAIQSCNLKLWNFYDEKM